MRITTSALLLASLVGSPMRAQAGEAVPLDETPAIPMESSHQLEIVRRYNFALPEEVALNPTQTFFLTGTDDGYVSKVDLKSGESTTALTPKDFNPNAFADATNAEVRAFCDGTDGAVKGPLCGRVLGIKNYYNAGAGASDSSGDDGCKFVLANAYFGVFETPSCQTLQPLRQLVNFTGGLVNDVVPTSDAVYFTTTFDDQPVHLGALNILNTDQPLGSLHRYDRANETSQVVVDKEFFFANGVEVSSNGKYIYVSESMAARIRKFNTETMQLEEQALAENLPIYPDNFEVKNGQVLVPGFWRNPTLDNLLRNPEELEAFRIQNTSDLLAEFGTFFPPVGTLLLVDEASGAIQETIFDKNGVLVLPSSAHWVGNGNDEFLVGSPFVPFATHFRVVRDDTAMPTVPPTRMPDTTTTPEPTSAPASAAVAFLDNSWDKAVLLWLTAATALIL